MNIYEEFKDGKMVKGEYESNQYEDFGDKGRSYYKQQVPARYIDQGLEEYNETRLIRALPPIFDTKQVLNLLEKRPKYGSDEKDLPAHLREHAIYRLGTDCLFILRRYLDLYKAISIVIRRNYVNKRIMTPEFIKVINHNSDILRSNKKNKISYLKSISSNIEGGASGCTIIGISGGGKTTALNNILSTYPQCIVHVFKDEHSVSIFKQVTYIKIDCSHDGSLKSICGSFLIEMDRLLEMNYTEKHFKARASLDYLIALVAHVTQLHALGVLIIDEIQHLSNSRLNAEKVLNFFVTLQNVLKVPIIYCGTYKAIRKVLSQDYRQARRATGIAEIHWNNMKKDREYRVFIGKLWEYQWVKKKIPLTEELLDIFYEKTLGITDRIVKLFMAVQLEAIITRKEEISITLIKKIADTKMSLTKPMIDALRSGDKKKISLFDDLYSFNFDDLQFEFSKMISESEKRKSKYLDKEFLELQQKQEVEYKLCSYLMELGIDKSQASIFVDRTIEKHGYDKKLATLKNYAIGIYFNESNKEIIEDKSSIQSIGYKELKKEGLIKDDII